MNQRTPLDPKKVETAKLTIAMGSTVKETAESLGLPYEALRKRAQRENWPSSSRVNREAEKIITTKATTALAESIAERGSRYVDNVQTAGLKVSEYVSRLDGEEILKKSRDLAAMDTVARKSFGLDVEPTNANAINIAVLGEVSLNSSEASFYRKPASLGSNSEETSNA
jgi:hypothetical protein